MQYAYSVSEKAGEALSRIHDNAMHRFGRGEWYPWRPSYSSLIEFLCWFYENTMALGQERVMQIIFEFRPETRRPGRPKKFVPLVNKMIAIGIIRGMLAEKGIVRDVTEEEVEAYMREHEGDFLTKYSHKQDVEETVASAMRRGSPTNVTNREGFSTSGPKSATPRVQSEVEPGRQLIP